MRFLETHCKGNKKNHFPLGANGVNERWKKNNLSCAIEKTHGKLFFTVRLFFAVRPVQNARQAPERKRTTKIFTHEKFEFSRSVCFLYGAMHVCACALIDQSRRKEGTKLSLELNIRYNEFVRHPLPSSHTTVRFNYYSLQCTYVTNCINWCCSLQYAYVTNRTNCVVVFVW
jgi:hypothetical protein